MAGDSQGAGAPSRRSGSGLLVGGIVLVVVGLLVGETFAPYFLPALGVVFLVWGAVIKQIGPLIPGGILLGFGATMPLAEGPFRELGQREVGA